MNHFRTKSLPVLSLPDPTNEHGSGLLQSYGRLANLDSIVLVKHSVCQSARNIDSPWEVVRRQVKDLQQLDNTFTHTEPGILWRVRTLS
jgi:hypothetical protein